MNFTNFFYHSQKCPFQFLSSCHSFFVLTIFKITNWFVFKYNNILAANIFAFLDGLLLDLLWVPVFSPFIYNLNSEDFWLSLTWNVDLTSNTHPFLWNGEFLGLIHEISDGVVSGFMWGSCLNHSLRKWFFSTNPFQIWQ